MTQPNKEIAKEMVIAWLSNNSLPLNSAGQLGQHIGEVYNAILATIGSEEPQAAGITREEDPSPGRRRRTR